MTLQKINYYSEINYLRGFAILSVISIHISDYFNEMTNINLLTVIYMVINALSQAAVPAFVFISGFVLYNSYNANFKIIPFYIKKLKYILPPYIIFSTFYIVFDPIMRDESFNLSFSDILTKYLTGDAFYHLWFFILIISLYILYPLVLNAYIYFKSRNKIALCLTLVFLVGVIGDSVFGEDFLFKNCTVFIGYLFYFVFGIFMKNSYEQIKLKSFFRHTYLWIVILTMIGPTLIIRNYANEFFSYDFLSFDHRYDLIWAIFENSILTLYYTVFTIIMLYFSTILSKSKQLPIIDIIGSYSFAIFLIHPIFLDIIASKLSEIDFSKNNLLFYPTMFILTLILSILLVKVIEHIPSSKYIIGKIKPRSKKELNN